MNILPQPQPNGNKFSSRITIICADTANIPEAIWALERCVVGLNASKAKMLTDLGIFQENNSSEFVEFIPINKINDISSYSKLIFMA